MLSNPCKDFRDLFYQMCTSVAYLLVYHCKYIYIYLSCTIFDIFHAKACRDLEIYARGHSMSLDMARFDRLHRSPYLSSVVTVDTSCVVFEIKRDIGRISCT